MREGLLSLAIIAALQHGDMVREESRDCRCGDINRLLVEDERPGFEARVCCIVGLCFGFADFEFGFLHSRCEQNSFFIDLLGGRLLT